MPCHTQPEFSHRIRALELRAGTVSHESDVPLPPWLLTLVEAIATLAFALSGLLEAARKRPGAVGVCLAGPPAGGGTLRDVLLDRRPDLLGVPLRVAVAGRARLGPVQRQRLESSDARDGLQLA